MAWPIDAVLPIKQELLINGSWVNITSATRGDKQKVTINRGSSAEQAQTTLAGGSASFSMKDPTGQYVNRNPLSPYYGLIGPNTRYRCSVTLPQTSLRLTNTNAAGSTVHDGARAWTADKGALDVTGDLDVRIECEPDDWRGRLGQILASKYQSTALLDNRSWSVMTDHLGIVQLIWSTAGTAGTRVFVRSTQPIPEDFGRGAIRVVLDVNNGGGGSSVFFYTSTSINGTWTQLGATVSGGGVTSIFSSSAQLEVGTVDAGGDRGFFGSGFNSAPFTGKIYAFEMRNGINGTVVARMDATAQPTGTTSWSDGLGNTWNLAASAEITNADYRFVGEVPEMPVTWDESGRDVAINVTASDIIERGRSGRKQIRSPLFYYYSNRSNIDAYFPLESGPLSGASVTSAYTGKNGITREASYGTAAWLSGSSGSLRFTSDNGFANGFTALGSAAPLTQTNYIAWFVKMGSAPSGAPTVFQAKIVGGTLAQIELRVGPANYQLIGTDAGGTQLINASSAHGGAIATTGSFMRVLITGNFTTTSWDWTWYNPQDQNAPVTSTSNSFAGGYAGVPVSWQSPASTGKSGLELAHVVLARTNLNYIDYNLVQAMAAYKGEAAVDRAARLCAQEGMPFWWIGPDLINNEKLTAPMGIQAPDTLLNLLQQCAAVDGGQIYSPRDKFGITIRGGYNLINRSGAPLTYTNDVISPQLRPREPQQFRNDVTVTAPSGVFARAEKTSGAYNVNEPTVDPQGIGRYEVDVALNSADAYLRPLAERELARGTSSELRHPEVTVELHRPQLVSNPTLSASLAATDIGEMLNLFNLPYFGGGPDTNYTVVTGYTEELGNILRTLTFATAPGGIFQAGTWGSASRTTFSLWGAKYTTLNASINSSATSLTLAISNVLETWTSSVSGLLVEINGEWMAFSSIGTRTGTGPWTQSVGSVSRSINGVVRSHAAGSKVRVVQQGFWAWKAGTI